MCRWCVRLRSHRQTTFPPHPPTPHPPSPSGLYATDGAAIPERETNSDIIIAGSAKLRTWKEKAPSDRVSSPLLSPRPHYTSSAVCGRRYNPEQRSLEARNERAETSFAIAFESGPNASLRTTIVHRLRVFSRRKLSAPKREKEEGPQQQKRTRRHTQVGGYNVSSKPTTGK